MTKRNQDGGYVAPEPGGYQRDNPVMGVGIESMVVGERSWPATYGDPTLPTSLYLTVAEAAAHYRVTEETIQGWCRVGRLEAQKVGNAWLIKEPQDGDDAR